VKRCLVLLLLVLCAVAWPQPPKPGQADKIIVFKSERKLQLLRAGKVIREYHISLGLQPVGKKTQQGDYKTPEGNYVIDGRNRYSQYHRALHISYPNAADRAAAAKLGVNPGGDVMIHGLPNSYQPKLPRGAIMTDWTWGCIALTDVELDEIWDLVPNGTPVEIRP
jgi:murein L,D-transpeptidase YafK